MENLDLIANRRREVLKILEEAQKALDAGQAELQELDIAGRTLARLSGGTWPPAGEDHTAPTPKADKIWTVHFDQRVRHEIPVTKMILGVMEKAGDYAEMMDGLTPKEVRQEIQRIYDKDVKGEYVSTQMWRLAARGDLVALGSGRYRLGGDAEKDKGDGAVTS